MGWTIFEISTNVYQAFVMTMFLRIQMDPKYKIGFRELLCVSSITIFFTFYLFFDMKISDRFVFLIPFLYSLIEFRNKPKEIIFWILILAVVMMTSTMLSIVLHSLAFGGEWEQFINQSTWIRFEFVILTNLLFTGILACFAWIHRGKGEISPRALNVLLTQNIFGVIILEGLFYYQQQDVVLDVPYYLAGLLGILFSISSLIEYEVLSDYADKERIQVQEMQMLQSQIQHQDELQGMHSQIQILRHDFKQHIHALEELLKEGKTEEGQAYIHQYKHLLSSNVSSGNQALDALLLAKKNIMDERGIEFHLQTYPLKTYKLNDVELCVVVGNLLDNAIEGVSRMNQSEKKEIDLRFQRSLNISYIICRNPVDLSTIVPKGDGFLTSKNDKSLHGIGLKSVKNIVEKAGGTVNCYVENNDFKVLIQFIE